jgi:hypothetical protein
VPVSRFSLICCFVNFSGTQKKSKWFETMNFVVTDFTSYFNDRPKGFTHSDCEEHFYPKDARPTTEVKYAVLSVLDFTGLLAICLFTTILSLLILCVEIILSKCRKITTVSMEKSTTFSVQHPSEGSPLLELVKYSQILYIIPTVLNRHLGFSMHI